MVNQLITKSSYNHDSETWGFCTELKQVQYRGWFTNMIAKKNKRSKGTCLTGGLTKS